MRYLPTYCPMGIPVRMKIISYPLVTLVLLTMSLSAWTQTKPAPFDALWNAGRPGIRKSPEKQSRAVGRRPYADQPRPRQTAMVAMLS
jgi:hypothetical protein